MGTTVFSNDANSPRVDWDIDGYAVKILKDDLDKSGRYKVDYVNLSQDEILAIFKDPERSLMYSKAQAVGADTIVTTFPGSTSDYLRSGYGLFDKNTLGLSSTCVYAMFKVQTYDVKRRTSTAWELPYNTITDGPCLTTDKVSYKANFADYTSAEKDFMQRTIKDKVASGIGYALKDLELTN